MNLVKTLSLLVLFVLGGYFAHLELNSGAEPEIEGEAVFPEASPNEINFIHISREGERISLERSSQQSKDSVTWRLLDPPNAPADSSEVSQLLKAISSLSSKTEIPSAEFEGQMGASGLDDPQMMLSFMQGEKESKIRFGKAHPLSGRRYAMREGSDLVLLVSNVQFVKLDKSGFDLRDKEPVDFKPELVKTVSIVQDGLIRFRIEKDEGSWLVKSDQGLFEADNELIETTLFSLSSLRAERFIDVAPEAAKVYGFLPPKLRVEVMLDDHMLEGQQSEPIVILFGQTKVQNEGEFEIKHYFKLAEAPFIYQLAGYPHRDFMFTPTQLRAKTPLDKVEVGNISKVSLGGFSEAEAQIVNIEEQPEIQDFLKDLRALQVLSYLDEEDMPLGELSKDIILIDTEDSIIARVTVMGPVLKGQHGGEYDADAPRYVVFELAGKATLKALVSSAELEQLEESFSKIGAKPQETSN